MGIVAVLPVVATFWRLFLLLLPWSHCTHSCFCSSPRPPPPPRRPDCISPSSVPAGLRARLHNSRDSPSAMHSFMYIHSLYPAPYMFSITSTARVVSQRACRGRVSCISLPARAAGAPGQPKASGRHHVNECQTSHHLHSLDAVQGTLQQLAYTQVNLMLPADGGGGGVG